MNNPYSQHPQQQYETGRDGRWGADDRGSQTWRDDNSNRAQSRSSQQYGQQSNYGQQGGYGQQERYGQQSGQSRYSPNFSGQQYGQEWQGGNYDDNGFQGQGFQGQGSLGHEFGNQQSRNQQFGNQPFSQQQRRQWGQEFSPYSGQGGQEYQPNITPREYQPERAGGQRWQGRSQANTGSQFGRQQESWQSGESNFSNPNYQAYGQGNQNYGQGNQNYTSGQHYGSESGSDQLYGRSSFQSGQSTGAFGLQQSTTHRGKGPKGYARTDERIREEICELLSDDFHVDASEITVEVKDSIVTLEGNVQDRTLKHRVEDIADNTSGVKDVRNNLRVIRQASQQATGDKTQEKTAPKSH